MAMTLSNENIARMSTRPDNNVTHKEMSAYKLDAWYTADTEGRFHSYKGKPALHMSDGYRAWYTHGEKWLELQPSTKQ